MKKWLCLALALCLLPLTALGAELTEFTVRERLSLSLADGVTYRQWDLTPKTRSAGMSQRVHLLEADPAACPGLSVVNLLGQHRVWDNLTPVSRMVKTDQKALPGAFLAAVNGDFFDEGNGGPVGYNMEQGEWLTLGEFYDGWAVGFTKDGRMLLGQPRATVFLSVQRDDTLIVDQFPIRALNAARADRAERSVPMNVVDERRDNLSVLYTPRYDQTTHTQGGTELILSVNGDLRTGQTAFGVVQMVYGAGGLPENTDRKGLPLAEGTMVLSAIGEDADFLSGLRAGDRVYLTCRADPLFDEAVTVSGGGRPDHGPLLILNGKPADILQAQELDANKEYFYSHHARNIAAKRADGSWFFLVIEGYRAGSYGMPLEWAQQVLLDLGAVTAVNLDGGPSATMVTALKTGEPFLRSDNSGGRRAEKTVGNALALILTPAGNKGE